jgi:hypothetical protein
MKKEKKWMNILTCYIPTTTTLLVIVIEIEIIVTVTKIYSVYMKYYSKQGEKIVVLVLVLVLLE